MSQAGEHAQPKVAIEQEQPAQASEAEKTKNQLKNEAKRLEKEAKYTAKLAKQAAEAAAKPSKAATAAPKSLGIKTEAFVDTTVPGEKKGTGWCSVPVLTVRHGRADGGQLQPPGRRGGLVRVLGEGRLLQA